MISIHGGDYYEALLEDIDEDQIPTFYGGKNDVPYPGQDKGPWTNYDIISEGEIIGVRRKDNPDGPIFTP